nr:MAG TPA: hypothetical protein [Caudoviricetes sp.]
MRGRLSTCTGSKNKAGADATCARFFVMLVMFVMPIE